MKESIDSIFEFFNIKKSDKIIEPFRKNKCLRRCTSGPAGRDCRERCKNIRRKKETAADLGMSLRQYRSNRKEYGNNFLTSDDYLKNFGESQMFQNNPVNSRWRPYPWPEYENPLDTSSYVNMNGKKFIDLQNSKYLYQKKTKKKMCIDLDKCKKVELKNNRLKKEILHTQIRLEYLKNKNAKKLEKINSLKKEIDRKVINESMLILIIIISFILIFIVRYYLKVLHRIKI